MKTTGLSENGSLTILLQDLEYCGFIRHYNQFGRNKNGAIYQLIDNYTLFYHHFILRNDKNDKAFWSHNINTPAHNTWCGLSFERVVTQHVQQAKQALGIAGVLTQEYGWKSADAQIDLLIDRQDDVINLCEMKFYQSSVIGLESLSEELVRKREVFTQQTSCRKAVFITLITTYTKKEQANTYDIQNILTINDLFI